MYLCFLQLGASLAESFSLFPFCSRLRGRFSLLFVWVASPAAEEEKCLLFLRAGNKGFALLLCCSQVCPPPPPKSF